MRNERGQFIVGSRPEFVGDKNPAWKGDVAGSKAIHARMQKTNVCSECGVKGKTDMALIHGCETHHDHRGPYSINAQDYKELCRRCHNRYDHEGPLTSEHRAKLSAANKGKMSEPARRGWETRRMNE